MVRKRPQAIIPENLTPRISATPECRPMAASIPRVLNLKDRSARPRIPAAFSRPNVEGHPLPTPGIDGQLQCCKRFHLRVRRYTLLRHVPSELATHQVLLRQRWDCLQNFYRLVAYGFAVGSDRRLHRQLGEDLKQVILDHVADGAGLIIKGAPALNPEVFRHRD